MTEIAKVKLRDFEIGGDKLTILAGPCAMESKDILFSAAEALKKITSDIGVTSCSNALMTRQTEVPWIHTEDLAWKRGLNFWLKQRKSLMFRL